MKHLSINKYNVDEIELPKTKEELAGLLTDVYTEGFQDGYDDGVNEAKIYRSKYKTPAVD